MNKNVRVFSAVQPTGVLHLGNYLGALSQWHDLSKQSCYECLFAIADLHALTLYNNPQELKQQIYMTLAAYLSFGLEPSSVLFIQSQIPEHTMLGWLLTCQTPMSWLNRMTQFKSKNKQSNHAGLYIYPCLMAADILLYNAQVVPIGEDQVQHLELVNDLVRHFNHTFKSNYWQLVTPLLNQTPRIMSLQDGNKKMSKSDPLDYSRINLLDSPDIIKKKIMRAKTDDKLFPIKLEELDSRPEIANLCRIYAAVSKCTIEQTLQQFGGQYLSKFKKCLIEILIDKLTPICNSISMLLNDKAYLDKITQAGKEKAMAIASKNWKKIKHIVGLI